MKNIFVINGSASEGSSNQRLVEHVATLAKGFLRLDVFEKLKALPHFDPELSVGNVPEAVVDFRKRVEAADGVLICTPEYVFSVPSGLKNIVEWCVATTVFSDKPLGIITASANGEKGHEELQLLMRTLGAKFIPETVLLIQGVKGKISRNGAIMDEKTKESLDKFVRAFKELTK